MKYKEFKDNSAASEYFKQFIGTKESLLGYTTNYLVTDYFNRLYLTLASETSEGELCYATTEEGVRSQITSNTEYLELLYKSTKAIREYLETYEDADNSSSL